MYAFSDMNNLSIENINIIYAKSEVKISDLFIDGYSFQETLKSKYKKQFEKGRFKDFFLPILGRDFSEKIDIPNKKISLKIPEEGEMLITPIYGCLDDCCVYVFAKVSRKNNLVYWTEIGRNARYVFDEAKKNDIIWLPNLLCYVFEINNYNKVINQLN
jgi:hypothetical protein